MDFEDKIRVMMRTEMDVKCPSCGSDNISIDKEVNTDVGILDTIICSDCEYTGHMVSSLNTNFVEIFC